MPRKRGWKVILLVLTASLLGPTGVAAACPGDGGPAPAEIKNHFCGTWNAAESRGLNPGTPLNNAFRFGGGWWRDFDGGAFGRGAIVEGDGVGFAYIVGQPWFTPYTGLGGPNSPLGYPVGRAEFGGHINNGARENKYMTFQGGVMNSWAAGTFATWGAILTKWDQLGDVSGPVGRPLSNEQQTARVDGRYSSFEGGNIIYNPRINVASLVYGGILNKYRDLGFSNHPLGLPTGDRQYNSFKGNEYQVFDGGVINQYGGRAFETHGALHAKWQALGGANGPVGLPTSDEQQTARVDGRYATFEGGNLIYDQATGQTWHVYGGILNKYAQLGYSNHPLGLPTADRRRGPVGNDYQTFQGGVINQYGGDAFETHGAILTRWERSGGPTGPLGLPTSDEHATARSPQGTVGRYARFQRGLINYNPKINQVVVLFGAILEKYASVGYAASYLGLPTGEEFNHDGGKRQNFEGGYIQWKPGWASARTDRQPSGGGTGGGSGSGTGGGRPFPPPNRPGFRLRAIGDSVTAAFGFEPDGRPASVPIILNCKTRLPTNECSSPNVIAYPAQYARKHGVRDWQNRAVSGATPEEWAYGRFRGELTQTFTDNPDVTLMTLGANPLLGEYAFGKDPCPGDSTADAIRTCLKLRLASVHTVRYLAGIYSRLLDASKNHLGVMHYHYTIPAFNSLRRRTTTQIFLEELNFAINEAVARLPGDQRRRIRVIPAGPFREHGCSKGPAAWVLLADSCIHPSAAGHAQFANAVDGIYADSRVPRVSVQTRTTGPLVKVQLRSSEAVTAFLTVATRARASSASPRRSTQRTRQRVRRLRGRRATRLTLRMPRGVKGRRLQVQVTVLDAGGNIAYKTVRLRRRR